MEPSPQPQSENLIHASDQPASVLSAPFVVNQGLVYYYEYGLHFEEPGDSFVCLCPASWHLDSLTIITTGFDKQRLTMRVRFSKFGRMKLADFQDRYFRFYKRLMSDFYNIGEARIEESFHKLPLLDLQKIQGAEADFASSFKSYIFLPVESRLANKTEPRPSLQIDERLIDRCLKYWDDPEIGYPLGQVDADQDILQARYAKFARYSVMKIFPSVRKTSALELLDYLKSLYDKQPGKVREQSCELIHKKLFFPIEKLRTMSLIDFIEAVPDQDQSLNDFFAIKQISKYHNLPLTDDDSLLHVLPICGAKSVLTTNPKENSNPNPLNLSFKNSQSASKYKARFIFLCGRYLRKTPLSLDFFKRLVVVPIGLFDLERRLINADIVSRFELSFKGCGEALYWKALQTKLIDLTDNYETLETLGDSVLKFVISVLLYAKFSWSESKMTYLRSRIINNHNLQTKGIAHRINHLVYNTHHKLSKWYPGYLVPAAGDEANKPMTQNKIAAVAVADLVEALIGSIYLSGERRLREVLDFLVKIDIWPDSQALSSLNPTSDLPTLLEIFDGRMPEYNLSQFKSDFSGIKRESTYSDLFRLTGFTFPRTGVTKSKYTTLDSRVAGLEEVIGYKFKNKNIIVRMLDKQEHSREFERLEYLGDAAIEMRAVDLAYTILSKYYRLFEPHDLHKSKIYLLSNHNMSFFASFFYLDCFVDEEIAGFCQEIREYSEISMFGQFLRHELSTLKVLGDLWECLLAAVLADGGWPAFDALYTKVALPFVYYISKFCKCIEGSAKSAAFEVIAKKKLKLIDEKLEDGQWKVKVIGEKNSEVLIEFTGDTLEIAEELCYFYISYKLNQ